MPKYAELIYNGFWFSPEREMLQALIDKWQEFVTGKVRLKLYKGCVGVVGRESPYSLYDQDLVTFEEGAVAYDHRMRLASSSSTRCACARSPGARARRRRSNCEKRSRSQSHAIYAWLQPLGAPPAGLSGSACSAMSRIALNKCAEIANSACSPFASAAILGY